MSNICMLYQGDTPHAAHKTFGDAVDCTYHHFETGSPPDVTPRGSTGGTAARICTGTTLSRSYDIVIAEGTAPLQTALVYGTFRNRRATIIYLGADETFFTLRDRPTKYLWTGLRPVSRRIIDGCVVISEQVYQWGEPYHGSLPKRIVHPPISDSKYDRLSELTPSSPSDPFRILSVGWARKTKNFSQLVAAVDHFRRQISQDVELILIGKGHKDQPYASKEFVNIPGYVPVETFVQYHNSASVYVQPSVADGYSVGVLEAMLGGTPTIATVGVGASHRLPDDHVCSPTSNAICDAIYNQYNTSESERIVRGTKHRDCVSHLTETNQATEFQVAIEQLTK